MTLAAKIFIKNETMIEFNTLSKSVGELEGRDQLKIIGSIDLIIYAMHFVDEDVVNEQEIQFSLSNVKLIRDSLEQDILTGLHISEEPKPESTEN